MLENIREKIDSLVFKTLKRLQKKYFKKSESK